MDDEIIIYKIELGPKIDQLGKLQPTNWSTFSIPEKIGFLFNKWKGSSHNRLCMKRTNTRDSCKNSAHIYLTFEQMMTWFCPSSKFSTMSWKNRTWSTELEMFLKSHFMKCLDKLSVWSFVLNYKKLTDCQTTSSVRFLIETASDFISISPSYFPPSFYI